MSGSHLSFVVVSYVLAIGAPLLLAIGASMRMKTVRRKLAAIDPGGDSRGGTWGGARAGARGEPLGGRG
jgi:hypothetical protein